MIVVGVSVSPPVGPTWAPTIVTRSQGMAPDDTKLGSEEELPGNTCPQTLLVSRECCHVTRIVPFSIGLGLLKWVMTCLSLSLNRGACGVKSIKAKPETEVTQGRQM